MIAAEQITRDGPPDASTFFSCPLPDAKNPSTRLSGGQKGDSAPSATASGTNESSDCTQSRSTPALVVTKAIRRPSGDTARRVLIGLRAIAPPGGSATLNRTISPAGIF